MSINSNGSGMPRTEEEDFAAFDRLSPRARAVVADAPINLDCVWVLAFLTSLRENGEGWALNMLGQTIGMRAMP